MPRKTIKSLEAQIENLVQRERNETNAMHTAFAETEQLKKRLQQIAGENESLRTDIKWYKSLIQNLVIGDKNALPR